jgi:hypothetical protein
MSARRTSVVATLLLVATVVVLLVSASSGAVRVWSDPPIAQTSRDDIDISDDPLIADPTAAGAQGDRLPPPESDGTGVVARVLAIALGVMLLRWAWFVVRFYLGLLRRRGSASVLPASDFERLPGIGGDEPGDLDVEVAWDLGAQLDALSHGSPRNAVVACWQRLEDDIDAAGIERSPAETAAELTERVLRRAVVDSEAVFELADLYREARFSSHDLSDRERARAMVALRRIHGSLRADPGGTGASSNAPAPTVAR